MIGYGSWGGDKLDADKLWAIIEALEKNDLLFYTHLLTGIMIVKN